LSFFHGRQQHVDLKAKELVYAWMFGVFGSQLTIGNTSFNKLLGICRDPLNVLKASGQRIFVRGSTSTS